MDLTRGRQEGRWEGIKGGDEKPLNLPPSSFQPQVLLFPPACSSLAIWNFLSFGKFSSTFIPSAVVPHPI